MKNPTVSTKEENAPASSYVRDTYDAMLPRLPKGYSEFRWNDTDISRFHYRQSKRALLKGLASVPQKLGRVLEIGGGGGAWTPLFAGRADSLDFLDISENMLKEARVALARFPHITYLHEDFISWSPDRAAYDLIVSIRNIEYMRDKRAVVERLASALRPGGALIVSTKSPHFDWKGYFKSKELHGGQIATGSLLSLLKENGFEIVCVYPAIIGKGIRYAPVRWLCDVLQMVSLQFPVFLMPVSLLKYISESFLVVARRV